MAKDLRSPCRPGRESAWFAANILFAPIAGLRRSGRQFWA